MKIKYAKVELEMLLSLENGKELRDYWDKKTTEFIKDFKWRESLAK